MTFRPRLLGVPYDEFTPARCAEGADRLEWAISKLVSWGFDVHRSGRLYDAVRVLRRVAKARSYGTTPEDLRKVAAAMILAGEFAQIAAALGDVRDENVAKELARALGGKLDEATHDGAQDIQAQFWFGTLMARGGMVPQVPGSEQERPDFICRVRTLEYAVEVKRPETMDGAERAISKAAAQCNAADKPGIVVLDLSRLFRADDLSISVMGETQPLFMRIKAEFQDRARSLGQYILAREREEKYRRVAGMVAYVRSCYWPTHDATAPRMMFAFAEQIVHGACGGLVYDHTVHFHRQIQNAMREIGNPMLVEREMIPA